MVALGTDRAVPHRSSNGVIRMKDKYGKWIVERGKTFDWLICPLSIPGIYLLGVFILIACSNQQSVTSTICGDGYHILGGLDNMIEVSNNEQWILANCESENETSIYTRIFRVDGSVSWKISLDDFPWNTDENDPLARLTNYHWMEDGKRVYLHPICCYDPGNHGVVSNAYGLYLLNLQTGEFSIILSGEINDASPFSVCISPDGKYLVHVDLANTPNILSISNLLTGEERTIKLDERYEDTGSFVWTPDNDSLLFTSVFGGWESSSLFILEMSNFMLRTIVENDERLLFPTSKWDYQGKWGSWKDKNTLFLVEMGKGKDWAVNIQKGEITVDNSYDGPP